MCRSNQQDLLTAAREKYDDFREVPQDFQNHALRRNDKAFTNFRRRCKENATKKGYPRYKKRVRSLTWSLRKYTKVVRKKTKDTDKQTIRRERLETRFRHNGLKVPKLGEVKIYMHRPLVGDPKEVTLVKKASGWYAHISCEIEDAPKVEPTDAIGVDMGTTHYLTTSEGEKEDNPRWHRKAEAYSINTLTHNPAERKVATAGRKPCRQPPYTMNALLTNVKTLSVNSSINSTTT